MKTTLKNCLLFSSTQTKQLILSAVLLSNAAVFSNNLQITGITVNQAASTVGFNISWDNSWNIAGTGAPNNWDAVWLFIKYKDCNATAATPFTHGVLSATYTDHTIPASLDVMSSVNWNGAAGINESAIISSGSLDFTEGIMLRPHLTGTGTVGPSVVILKIPSLPGAATNLTVDVFGIEMVYVPKGDFTLGDGNGAAAARDAFIGSAVLNASPMTITSVFETAVSTLYYQYPSPATTIQTTAGIPAAFPKGNYGFYMMKYEITEGQYAEFLNTLGTAQQGNRAPGGAGSNRNQLQQTTLPYSTNRSDRVQNFLNWGDLTGYLDWACLRPHTELEFEKACRGNGSTTGEYAWGNLVIAAGITFAGAGAENGTETFSAGNAVYNNNTFTNGDAGQGPVRAGIFATSSSTRQTAGASYYGVMELSGNVMEYVVGVHSTAASNALTRTWGDGALDAAGNPNVGVWPATGTTTANSTTTNLIGLRGGAWNNGPAQLQTSDRYYMYESPQSIGRNNTNGGRGVR